MLKTRAFIDTLSFIFILSLFMQTSGQNRTYVYVSDTVTQPEALNYCREHYTDLATFRNKDDINAVRTKCSLGILCWIGLQRDKNDSSVWNWSDGDKTDFTQWALTEPNNLGGQENCVVLKMSFWFDTSCDNKNSFLCYEEEPILVQENKTWEEALEYCRNLHPAPLSSTNYFKQDYDLLHIRNGNFTSAERKAIVDAQTQEVWIGLRFLAGNWLWVNGKPLLNQLPVCPTAGNSCGTMSKTWNVVQLSNCSETRNFFCSRN